MMENKKLKTLSITALIASLLPLATFVPIMLHITLEGAVQTAWAGANMAFVALGLLLSVICVSRSESRSAVNILSTVISVAWCLLMLGIVALAVVVNFQS
jgi:hypothetical protein